jgi:acyl transferase domain-containing protein
VFDTSFFNISPKEAEAIDPQQRMMLEVVYEALESAGYTLQQYSGDKVAVFAGLMTGDYDTLSQRDELDTSQYYATGNARSILSNRISYFFNLQGPSMTIDTACSSSLVALHQAVLSLRSGESKMACVTGANLILTPEQFVVESNLHMLSPSGHCRMWDAGADGYARGEGVVAMFIKTLSQALADGDHIEAVIRETGVNSDGRSRGITMPNWEAQSRLIQDTYRRAGLDPNSSEDRCQYFEAHGTGTSAGDPNEARAIENAFFGNASNDHSDSKLLVGSIKTVIGHTEGAAGLAGLLKVIQSMRHGVVPPNLHFDKLNPDVESYYSNLLIPTSSVPWPAVPVGQPRRGSVNSFGFGGTNSHVIVEQYIPKVHSLDAKTFSSFLQLLTPLQSRACAEKSRVCLPLVLSAPSQKSLVAVVKSYRNYLARLDAPGAEEVAWHTYARRTAFSFRLSVSSPSVAGLVDKLNSLVAKTEISPGVALGVRVRLPDEQPKILGIFTGQGAQWATMSRGLLFSCRPYADTIRSLDKILQTCPDPPSWTLEKEILADEHLSRVKMASVSQCLCTAIQLALIELLRHLGITFHTVVGHSSGEIAAAYAAGKICIRDAILISHYRGMGVYKACGVNRVKGAMLAAGLSKEEGEELCASPQYSDRLWVAASNAPSSITLSGDIDAVEEACKDLTDRQRFARSVFVDTAYHSPHMTFASVEYLKALKTCHIASTKGNGTIWVSSVFGAGEPGPLELAGPYWKDNMVKPVLFHEAVFTALETFGPFDCGIEVGPHPALMNPVARIMKAKNMPVMPYSGLLNRKLDDREAFADFLGWMWTNFGSSSPQIRDFVSGSLQPQLVNTRLADPPTYPWDHSQVFYRESRISRQYHFKSDKPHELLGVRTRDDNKHQLRWRNILKFDKVPWAKHHSFQGEALLPASAYMIMALDASRVALAGRQASVVELRDLKFFSGVILEQNAPGVEVLFNLTIEHESPDTIEATFTLTSAVADGRSEMKKNFSGSVTMTLGKPSADALPSRPLDRAETLHANPKGFYDMMAGTGLVYTSAFKGLETLERRYNFASGTLKKYHEEDTTSLSISPATLDSCLQTAFVTISSPGDNTIWNSFLPLDIECVRFNMSNCDIKNASEDRIVVDAYMTKSMPITTHTAASFTADIEIFNPDGDMEIQVEGLTVGSISSTKPEEDYELYLTTKFDVDPDAEIVSTKTVDMDAANPMLAKSCERVAAFYVNQTPLTRPRSPTLGLLLERAENLFPPTSWPQDTEETLDKFVQSSPHFVALDFIRELGKNLPEGLVGMLPAIVEEAHQLVGFQQHVSRVVGQIAHKYPRMSVLGLTDPEMGLTEHILTGLDSSFVRYRTGTALESNLDYRIPPNDRSRRKMMVDKLDLNKSEPDERGSYDLVLLATSVIEPQKTASILKLVRRMMRRGGFLVLLNVSRSPLKDRIRRYAGISDGTTYPLSPPDWPDLLDQCGFGYSMKNGHQYYPPGFSMIVRQADCPEKRLLLHPFSDLHRINLTDRLLVIGGKKKETTLISEGICSFLTGACGVVERAKSLETLDPALAASFSAVILLNDIDKPILGTMTEKRMEILRILFRPEMIILWVTHNARFDNPDQAASFGFTRTLTAETPGLALQMLDLDTVETVPAVEVITETFARLTKYRLAKDPESTKALWVNEPEIYLESGRRLVPRVVPWKEGNDRVNAPRRIVANTVNTLEKVVHIVPAKHDDGDTGLYEIEVKNLEDLQTASGQRPIQVDYSTVEAVNIGSGSSYLCIGHDINTGKLQIALSDSNTSYIAVPASSVNTMVNATLNQPLLLALLVRYLVALNIANATQGQSILLVEPDAMFYNCLKQVLGNCDTGLRACSSDATRCSKMPGAVYLHHRSPSRAIKALYPPEGTWILDMSAGSSKLSELLVRALPKNCKYTAYSSVPACPNSNIGGNTSATNLWEYAVALALAETAASPTNVVPAMSAVPDLLGAKSPLWAFQTINWKAERSVSHIVKQLAVTHALSATKTYVLAGLTRDLGQSLCTLFVQQGARHIVLCSRNPPKVQPKWQTEMIANGITICFEVLDVTCLEAVVSFKKRLAKTLPPVGGVVNGAMVLEDRVFSRMSLETLHRVMRPKTVGSKNLDQVFDSPGMDFFIMTSSFAAIGGHAGQSNYAAANMYMNGLATSRRRRGLPGSVLNIGVIYGLGFLHREKDGLYSGLEREGYPPTSERDLHHMFTEAIAAGHPSNPSPVYDITTGLRRFPAHDPTLAWHHDPRFSHFTRHDDDGSGSSYIAATASNSSASTAACSSHPRNQLHYKQQKHHTLRCQLDAATTAEEITQLLSSALVTRLRAQLQLSPPPAENNSNKDDDNKSDNDASAAVTSEHSPAELGVDSLAAG